MQQWVGVWFQWVHDWGYLGIVMLMAMESSVIPIPSEIVIPPAAYWAAQGRYSFGGVVLAGAAGSYLGAAATYWAARWLGRPLLVRYGRFLFCPETKLLRAERWLARYEAGGVFFARLVPVVRHLIGIPAGLWPVQPGDAARGGAVVLGAGLVRRPPAGRPSGPAERPCCTGAGAARALVAVWRLRHPAVRALRARDAPNGPRQ